MAGTAGKATVGIARIVRRCFPVLLVTVLAAVAAGQANPEESVNPEGVLVFSESTPVKEEGLAEVHSTGVVVFPLLPRSDVAVILWDEQPKTKPAPSIVNESGAGSHAARAAMRVR
jgi:hypothetical protein